jgi:hypothetical protein
MAPPPLHSVLRRGAIFIWHQYEQLDDPNYAGQTKPKFVVILSNSPLAMSRRLLKFSGGSVDDYATFSTSTASPSC